MDCELTDSGLEIVYWTSLGVFVLSVVVSLVLWFYVYFKSILVRPKQLLKGHYDKTYYGCPKRLDEKDLSHAEDVHIDSLLVENRCFLSFDALSRSTIIFFLQIVLYATFLMGQGTVYSDELSICIPWARWAVYSVSCSLLAYEIAIFQKMVPYVRNVFTFLITATLLTGLFTTLSVSSEINRFVWYGIGFVFYIPALLLLFLLSDPFDKLKGAVGWYIPIFVLITWTFYPIIFILTPALFDVISLSLAGWLYLASDLLTKVFFSFWISYLEARY